MKRHLVLAVSACLLASVMLVAQPPATAAPPLRIGIAYDTADNSWSEDVAAGVARAASEYKLTVFDEVMIDKHGRLTEPSDVLSALAKKRPSLVLAVGFLYSEAVVAAAAAYPQTNFAVIDNVPESLAPNSQAVMFAGNEGSFLVGAAAALTSTSPSPQIGFIGGAELPVIQEYRAGFVAGVAHVDPLATVEVVNVGDPESGFSDPAAAYEIALGMYNDGIDVIYGAAGGSTIGITYAARDFSATGGNEKVWMIGVDYDFYEEVDDSLKPFVLTSMIKRVDVAAYETVIAQATGTFSGGGVELFDLARDGVDYATSGGYVEDIEPILQEVRQEIIDDVITVPDM